MSIKSSQNSKQQALSGRSPVRSLLESTLAAAMDWVSRKKDDSGNRIGKVTNVEGIIKYAKDTFSIFGRCGDKSISINDIRGKAVFLRRMPDGRIFIPDYFLFCVGSGKYILTNWITVCRVLNKLNHDRGTVIYKDAWRMDRNKFLTLLQKEISDKI